MSAHRHLDPLLRALAAPWRSVFFPLGFRLELETNDPRIAECAEASFGVFRDHSFAEQPGASRSGSPPLRMRLLAAPGATAQPPWPAAAYRSWGDLFSVVCGPDNFLTADLGRGEAMGFFSPAMLEDREFFRWTFLDCAVYMILQHHYFTPVHAAAVVRDGQGILLCGPAGAGKTSLAYACARAGYGLLADDVVHLLRSERPATLRGNPATLHFPVTARELFPELNAVPVGIRRDGAEFLAVPTARFLPGRAVTEAEPGPLIFLERDARPLADGALDPFPAAEAHRMLFESLSLVGDEEAMAEHSRTLAHLVGEGAYRLRYSTLEQARRQLEELPLRQRISR